MALTYNSQIDYNSPIDYDDINTWIFPPTYDFSETVYAPYVNEVVIQMPYHIMEYNFTAPEQYNLEKIKVSGAFVHGLQLEDSYKLEADAYIDLFQIELSGNSGTLFLKNNTSANYLGQSYEGTLITIDGVALYSDDTLSRPTLEIYNPEGVYSYFVDSNYLNNALVTRIRVLKTHLENNVAIYKKQRWRLSRVSELNRYKIKAELRDTLDGQNFVVPGRMFIPPEFPVVSIR